MLLILYVCNELAEVSSLNRVPFVVFSIIISTLYLIIYRKNGLFCYETFFLIFYILSAFFHDIIIKNLVDTSTVMAAYFNTNFSDKIKNKGIIVNTICLVVFLLAATHVNEKPKGHSTNKAFIINRHLSSSINILTFITGGYILYLGGTGIISSWFKYSNIVTNYSNTEIVYLTMLFLVLTSLEFSKLSDIHCKSFKSFIKNVNKCYLTEVLLIGSLLLISGNRNESLLILLPIIVSYHIFIKSINNRQFLIMLLIGITVMALIGLTRNSGSLDSLKGEAINMYDMTRDFGFVDNNTKYLIDYTDQNSPTGFKNALLNIFSSIPFLGGLVVSVTGLSYDIRTTELTTIGMQLSNNMESGLGTSLLGDLYYTGGILFTLFFMYCFGALIASLYKRFTIEKRYNIWSLIIYLFMFSNVIYAIRAEWTMPFRYIGFSFIILLVLRLFQPYK